jgi:serine/threonine-protein kinase
MARRLTDDHPGASRILAERGVSRDGLRRRCQGDLDTILARALKRNPIERYQTVTAFSDDIRRYQRNEPVLARPDRWGYRARKFVRRHRAGVAAAAVVTITLSAAIALTSVEMIEARRQRDRAEFQARRATASSEFMRYLVTQIGNKPMTMTEVLDRGRIALEQQYQSDPSFVARMLVQLSGPYIESGDVKTASQMMARALELASTLDEPELLATTNCGRAYDLLEERDLEGARRHLAACGPCASVSQPAPSSSIARSRNRGSRPRPSLHSPSCSSLRRASQRTSPTTAPRFSGTDTRFGSASSS